VEVSPAPLAAQTFLNNAKCIAVDDAGAIHMAFLASSSDGGVSFAAPTMVSEMFYRALP